MSAAPGASGPAGAPRQGQLRCCGCGVTLAYPVDAPCVRCPICTAVTGVNQVHIRCVSCHVCLALPPNAQLARCPRCQTIMQMPRLNSTLQRQQESAASAGPPKQVIYIENPPMKDGAGHVISATAVGTKLEDDA
jgi:LSD1 subclass zinc finger protein